MTPKNVPLTIYQGSTFRHPFYWYAEDEVVKTITAISRTYPTLITAAAHGLPTTAVPASIIGVPDWLATGLKLTDRHYATKVSTDTFSVPIDGTDQDAYDGVGGRLIYNAPMALGSGWTARMQIRASADDATVLAEFTDVAGITLGDDGSIVVEGADDVTLLLDFTSAVYDLELEDVDGITYRVAEGRVTLSTHVTKP